LSALNLTIPNKHQSARLLLRAAAGILLRLFWPFTAALRTNSRPIPPEALVIKE
jgi:hypothetical protein